VRIRVQLSTSAYTIERDDGTVIDLRSASERDICPKFITPALRRA
jgi:hypothetical protein